MYSEYSLFSALNLCMASQLHCNLQKNMVGMVFDQDGDEAKYNSFYANVKQHSGAVAATATGCGVISGIGILCQHARGVRSKKCA